MKEEINKILQSDDLTNEAKQKINSLLEGEVSLGVLDNIRDIIQSEIDANFNEAGIKIDSSEIDQKMNEVQLELSEIEKSLNEDIKTVEKELNNLENVVSDIENSVNQDKIEEIKKEIIS